MSALREAARLKPETTPLGADGSALQEWALPTETAFLNEFLSYVFSTYWDQIVWGPLIDGAAYELMCPCAPTNIEYENGYLTIAFDGPHFHLCTGEIRRSGEGPPLPEDYSRQRRPARAVIYRQLDAAGHPVTWGFSMRNGAGAPMISIFFASPFVTRADVLEKQPKWERLAMWRDIARRYLGREPEALDEAGEGFTKLAS